jgi:hypothetical protein
VISVHSNILMRKHILPLIAFGPLAAAAQTPTVRLINTPDASSKPEFAMVAAVRQLAGGRLLVNDINNRQLTILDPGLANAFVLADSTSGQLNSYGTRAGGLIRYVGDSTLFVDPAGLSMFVIDPSGTIARVASVPRSQDAGSLGNNLIGTPGVDAAGRLVYRAGGLRITQQGGKGGGGGGGGLMMPDFPDSTAIVRVDLATRKVDTAAYYKIPKTKMNLVQTDKGMTATSELNPMPIVDDWAVLSNGSVAIVRGQDYHVDILKADGTLASATKVPFDWQRLSDEEKVAVIDSAKAALDRARAAGPGDGNAVVAGGARGGGPGSGPGGMVVMSFRTETSGDGGGVGPKIASMGGGMQPSFVSASELPDYRPAFSQGAARADEDGNVWVRTSATRAGAIGGLIYDVINGQGALVDRVQIPGGRTIVGFGKGGVVYMVARDKTGAWIERTHR